MNPLARDAALPFIVCVADPIPLCRTLSTSSLPLSSALPPPQNMDLMDLGRGLPSFSEAVGRIGGTADAPSELLLMPVKQDALIPAREMVEVASHLGRRRHRVHVEQLSSHFGHDAFLLEKDWYCARIAAYFDTAHPVGTDAVRVLAHSLEH